MPDPLTPGQYLRSCREALELTLEELALRMETLPPVSAHRRAEWLADIEADAQPLSVSTAIALWQELRFDPVGLDELRARMPESGTSHVFIPRELAE